MMGWKSRFPCTESGFFLLGSKTCKPLVEASHPALGLGFAFLAGVDRVRGTGNVQCDVGIADAIGARGEYGWCKVTGEPIGLKRLLLRPTATLSIETKERQERQERHIREA